MLYMLVEPFVMWWMSNMKISVSSEETLTWESLAVISVVFMIVVSAAIGQCITVKPFFCTFSAKNVSKFVLLI